MKPLRKILKGKTWNHIIPSETMHNLYQEPQPAKIKNLTPRKHIPVEGGFSSPAAYFPITPPHLLMHKKVSKLHK